jgi:hypothetical protein
VGDGVFGFWVGVGVYRDEYNEILYMTLRTFACSICLFCTCDAMKVK